MYVIRERFKDVVKWTNAATAAANLRINYYRSNLISWDRYVATYDSGDGMHVVQEMIVRLIALKGSINVFDTASLIWSPIDPEGLSIRNLFSWRGDLFGFTEHLTVYKYNGNGRNWSEYFPNKTTEVDIHLVEASAYWSLSVIRGCATSTTENLHVIHFSLPPYSNSLSFPFVCSEVNIFLPRR